jgi:hypothetical protein
LRDEDYQFLHVRAQRCIVRWPPMLEVTSAGRLATFNVANVVSIRVAFAKADFIGRNLRY